MKEKIVACKEFDERFPWKVIKGLAPGKLKIKEIRPRFITSEGQEYLMLFERPKTASLSYPTSVLTEAIYIQDLILLVISRWKTKKYGGRSVYYFVQEDKRWIRRNASANSVQSILGVLGLLDWNDFDEKDSSVFKEAMERIKEGTKSHPLSKWQRNLWENKKEIVRTVVPVPVIKKSGG